jgi:ribosomal protein L32
MSDKRYPCINKCGMLISRKGSMCIVCRKAQRKKDALTRRVEKRTSAKIKKNITIAHTHKCSQCGKTIFYEGICPECFQGNRLADKSYKQHPLVKDICPKSPNKAHYRVIDNDTDIGTCVYCQNQKKYVRIF